MAEARDLGLPVDHPLGLGRDDVEAVQLVAEARDGGLPVDHPCVTTLKRCSSWPRPGTLAFQSTTHSASCVTTLKRCSSPPSSATRSCTGLTGALALTRASKV
ncbi:hypothetical protein [Nannocystis pusilla]|uniref:hypothetical protein n=1 Tax=Nannocystis pusilla TaxID=889268 RepID=UPI003DA27D26